MSWEYKGESKYYYQKYRVGNYVVSKYVGRGEIVELIADEDDYRRARIRIERDKQKREMEKERQYDRLADLVYERNTSIAKALLLINGYHTHKGQWRKKHV